MIDDAVPHEFIHMALAELRRAGITKIYGVTVDTLEEMAFSHEMKCCHDGRRLAGRLLVAASKLVVVSTKIEKIKHRIDEMQKLNKELYIIDGPSGSEPAEEPKGMNGPNE